MRIETTEYTREDGTVETLEAKQLKIGEIMEWQFEMAKADGNPAKQSEVLQSLVQKSCTEEIDEYDFERFMKQQEIAFKACRLDKMSAQTEQQKLDEAIKN